MVQRDLDQPKRKTYLLSRVLFIFMMKVRETQDGDMCRALVNAVMNLRVPSNAGNFLTS